MLLIINIDVKGACEELFKNDEFLYYLKMVAIESDINISPQ